jgi:type I restriction enzyme S subunit
LDNLKAIFDEVGAVSTEDLRKTILDLAVQGRLVRQELSDPVPSETFDQIKPIKTINDRFPRSWIISKYENLTDLITSGSRGWKEYYSNSGAIFVRAQNIKTDCLILNDIAYVSLPNRAEGKRSLIKRWDILITITGANVTKTALVKDDISEAYVSQHIALTRPKWPEMAEWLYLCFVSPAIGRGELERLAYGDKPGLNLNNIRDLKFPIPPLNEQHRIVAKVNQLMALIDKMEEQQARKAKVAQAFAQAAVAAITGTEIKEPEKMKAPKTELISRLQTRNAPNAADPAPLTKLLTEHNGELPAKALWQRSGLEIDAFYQQLRTEMANGWIIEPEKAVMKEIEAD